MSNLKTDNVLDYTDLRKEFEAIRRELRKTDNRTKLDKNKAQRNINRLSEIKKAK
ncbi:MAG: hypothetical protein KAQ85_01345 [Thermodesulfovibrionia bacterium]|nr:hypothetical protein [Thermodesulfovibrionia bacterium]